MQSESNIRPEPIAIERHGDDADLILCTNVQEEQREDTIMYTYEEYRLTVAYRDNLMDSVQRRLDEWIEMARQKEAESQYKPPTVEEQLRQLQEENAALKAQNQELGQVLDTLLGGDEIG